MRKRLDYIYYRFYRFQVSVGNGIIAVPMSLLFLSLTLNFFSVISALYAFFGINVLSYHLKFGGVIVIGIIITTNYFLFAYGKRYKAIIERYENEGKLNVKNGNLYVVVYVVFTLILFGFGLYFMMLRNSGFL